MKHTFIKAAINLCGLTRLYSFLCPFYTGMGVILGMHRVVPATSHPRIAANSRIEITPEFLEDLIIFFRHKGYEIISLDEMHSRLMHQKKGMPPFVCFTFDDGYVDIIDNALRIFERHQAPFAVYVVSRFADQKAVLWWYMIEDLVLHAQQVEFTFRGRHYTFSCGSELEKEATFEKIKKILMELDQHELPEAVQEICHPFGIQPHKYTLQLMSWKSVQRLSRHPLATIGAHTVHHYNLSQLSTEEEVEKELRLSKEIIESRTGVEIRHLAYPFGSRMEVGRREFEVALRCGFHTGVTVREGAIFPEHKRHTLCLPRIEITGRHQHLTLIDMRRCGLVSIIRNGLKRVVTE